METRMLEPEFIDIDNEGIPLRIAVQGTGPVILCVHGWPELWYSWRHQMTYFSALGFRVAAMDVRGYGGSGKPQNISAYTMKTLAGDVAAAIRALGGGPVILFGHDWGAPIAYNTALLYPDLVDAVAGLSVPYRPGSDVPMLALWKQLYPDRFFYMLYFQQEGAAEAEVEADIPSALRKIYYACSGDAPLAEFLKEKPAESGLLDGLIDPHPFPSWMSEADLQVYIAAFKASGLRGPINRYRAQMQDFEELAELRGRLLPQPACFIGGERDPVRLFVPGIDMYEDRAAGYQDLKEDVIVPGAGHWIQQEAPEATNAALRRFVQAL
jgi:pimeloyl-ACP methyl ester carboxylesterase